MKKRTIYLIGFIEFIILISTLLLFILASQKSMVFIINYASGKYELSYDQLEGNLLKSITLKNIKYRDKIIVKKAHVDLNFKSLLQAKIHIDDVTLEQVDLKVFEQMIKDQFSKKSDSTIASIPTININSAFFSTKEYRSKDINIDQLYFVANNIQGDMTNISAESFSFYTQNDHTNITANGFISKRKLNLDHLWISEIDLRRIEKFYKKFIKGTDKNQTKSPKKDNHILKNLIQTIHIDNFKTNIKPYKYKKYNISEFTLKAFDIASDFNITNVKKIDISSNTNMWSLISDGKIKNQKLITDIEIKLKDKYFKKLIPFFDFNKISPIKLKLEIDKNGLVADGQLKSSNILINKNKDINLSIQKVMAHSILTFSPINLLVDLDANLSTKYSESIALSSKLYYNKEDRFHYNGILDIDLIKNLNPLLKKLLKNSKIRFKGDVKKINADLNNKHLKAKYRSDSYKKAKLTTISNSLNLKDLFQNLPKELKEIETSFKLNTDIDFKNIQKLDTDIDLKSNALNFKGKLNSDKPISINGEIKAFKNSILKKIDKNIKLNGLFPIKTKIIIDQEQIFTKLDNSNFKSSISYKPEKNYLDIKVDINSDKFALAGNLDDKLFIKASSPSLRSSQINFSKFYKFKTIPLDGKISLNAIIKNNQDLLLYLKSRWLVYEYKPNKFIFAEKIKFDIDKQGNDYFLKNYYFSTYLDYDRIFYAKKSSKFTLKKEKLKFINLWINDQAQITGLYDIKKNKAELKLKTKDYHYKNREGDIVFDADIDLKYKKNSLDIKGEILTKDATVTYEAKKEHYIQDEDIIIVQEQRKSKKKSSKTDINIDVSLKSQKPLRYKIKNTDAKLTLDLKLWKDRQKEFELLGIVNLLKGRHFEGDKKFDIDNGEIIFAGAALNPYLNINVKHQSEPYDISLNINGLLESPIVNFSSIPYLSQSDILSILLFSSTTTELMSGDGDASKAALSMFGNTFAREIVENFGIKLDKLVLSTTEEGGFGLEVGKKISKKITIIYINDIVQTIKIKYQHSDRFETDITISPETSGIDFFYKKEY